MKNAKINDLILQFSTRNFGSIKKKCRFCMPINKKNKNFCGQKTILTRPL